MDMILISDTKLKVMLTPLDMEELALDSEDIDYDNTETRRAFWSILDEAKHKTGFDAARDRVFIQVYPSKSGGCELYVTKLARSDTSERRISCRVRRLSENNLSPNSTLNCEELFKKHMLCAFYEMPDLLDICAKLSDLKYDGKSAAYTDGVRYYLELCHTSRKSRLDSLDKYSFISEYGDILDGENVKPYINEHCRCICADDAVGVLSAVS